jgi:hypothetical protein
MALVPTRRILEVALIGAVLLHPIMGLARMWAAKTLLVTDAGSLSHGVAEVVAVVA